MSVHELAGKPSPPDRLPDIPRLVSAYYTHQPDPASACEQVSFGTSGHRGSSIRRSFNEPHILAIAQAICEYRRAKGIDGPLMLGADTHALSAPALATAIEVFAANEVEVRIQNDLQPVPTPVISHAILAHNVRTDGADAAKADGVVITPSHNPPEDGGFKYNPPTGGPAGSEITTTIQNRANEILESDLAGVRRMAFERALHNASVQKVDLIGPYIADLASAVDLEAVAASSLKLGADPLGGSSLSVWHRIAESYGLDLVVVNESRDPSFSFMPLDRDGKIRMDCSSPWAMRGLIELAKDFDIAFASDPDADRHGIVTRSSGLLNPNHYLAVAIRYLFTHRPDWPSSAQIGKTLVSSSMIDRVAADLGRPLCEVPVGFKWFAPGLFDGSLGFGGEESAGASFLRRGGSVWTTDKDGILLGLLAAEITATTGKDPGEHYRELEQRFGSPCYQRIDASSSPAEKKVLGALSPENVTARELAGEPILSRLTRAPGNNAAIGGLKIVTENGWFAARPSGTEDIYKIYAESFLGAHHLERIQEEARSIVGAALAAAEI